MRWPLMCALATGCLLLTRCTIPVTENVNVKLPQCVEIVAPGGILGDAALEIGACRDAGTPAADAGDDR
jgi:hypothetical protein